MVSDMGLSNVAEEGTVGCDGFQLRVLMFAIGEGLDFYAGVDNGGWHVTLVVVGMNLGVQEGGVDEMLSEKNLFHHDLFSPIFLRSTSRRKSRLMAEPNQ